MRSRSGVILSSNRKVQKRIAFLGKVNEYSFRHVEF